MRPQAESPGESLAWLLRVIARGFLELAGMAALIFGISEMTGVEVREVAMGMGLVVVGVVVLSPLVSRGWGR